VGTPLTLVATASSGLQVSFASATQNVCTINGTTASFIASGTCTIKATQAGNSTYAAAAPVSQSFTVSGALSSSGAPLILYTDLLSGPTSGGENNNGTYLSIFGQNFGTSGLGTTTKVFIGGVEVASYRYLGTSLGRPDVQQITVQVGALSGLTRGVHSRRRMPGTGGKKAKPDQTLLTSSKCRLAQRFLDRTMQSILSSAVPRQNADLISNQTDA